MRGALVLVLLVAPGCTHHFLQQNTLRTAGTLSDLQTQQVMDNLARLCANPKANPTHVTLSSGLVQVADQGCGVFASTLQSAKPGTYMPTLAAQRGVVEQWSVAPIVDGGQLETLQAAYHKALMPNDSDVDDDLKDQIVALCVRFTLLPSEVTLRELLQDDKPKKAIDEICKSLEKENKHWQEVETQAKASMNAKGKDRFELYLKAAEIKQAIDVRKEQISLLRSLSKMTEAKCDDAEKTTPRRNTRRDRNPEKHERIITGSHSAATSRRQPGQGTHPSVTSDTTLLILTALQTRTPAGYLPSTDLMWESMRNPALVDQAEDQIAALESLLHDDEFQYPWLLHSRCLKDVPHCACAVGHAKVCGEHCYVWVMPDDFDKLQKFTRILMTLTVNAQQDVALPSPAFSPTLSR